MHFLDLTFSTPAENLACDEALLDFAEGGADREILRFWESTSLFVVLGSSNRAGNEVWLDQCERDGVPILRRRSGGGAVLQGPGCLNYCLVLKMDGPCATITGTNSFVLQRHAGVLSSMLGLPVRHEGLTDLAVNGMKISGNSQRRRLRYLMFHGTFLLGLDPGIITRYLRSPSKEPSYRRGRSHQEFAMNITASRTELKEALRNSWNAAQTLHEVPRETMEDLVRARYSLREWNLKL